MDRLNTRVILRHNGDAAWLAPIILKSKCPINVKYFPFDTQTCSLKFGSWTYDKSRLDLLKEDEAADTGKRDTNYIISIILSPSYYPDHILSNILFPS